MGHCVAKPCGSLWATSEKRGREWMASLLGRLEPGVSCRLRVWFTIHLRITQSSADSSVLVSLLGGRLRGGDADENAEPRGMPLAVLLRRDIAALAG